MLYERNLNLHGNRKAVTVDMSDTRRLTDCSPCMYALTIAQFLDRALNSLSVQSTEELFGIIAFQGVKGDDGSLPLLPYSGHSE